MAEAQPGTTLREQLASAASALEAKESGAAPEVPAQIAPTQGQAAAPEPSSETPEQAASRLRDEKGRFAKGNDDGKEPPVQEAVAQPQKPRPPVPSTWKKDYRGHWDTIDPALAEYLVQREGEYAKGVSTYRQEWENARPLVEAIAPFRQTLEQYGVQPGQWIQSLGQAQLVLATGTPEQKRQMVQTICQQYGIDLNQQVQDGQQPPVYDPRVQQLSQQVQRLSGVLNNFQTERQRQEQETVAREIAAFQAKAGNEHYEQVRETMAGLLQSGLADDLQSAYDAALRHPRHVDIWEPIQRQQREAEEQKQREAKAHAARTAQAAAASVRTATPSAPNAKGGNKDLRSMLTEAYDERVGGRV